MSLNRVPYFLITVFAFVLVALVPAAAAQSVAFGTLQQDTAAPVEVTAEELSVDQESGTAIFTGDVLIGQGEMRLSAARVLVVYRDGGSGIERLEASGGVTLVIGPDAAEAEQADYNIDTGEIVMTGDVLLTQGRNVLTSDRMTVNLEGGTAQMTGRVRTILQPGGN